MTYRWIKCAATLAALAALSGWSTLSTAQEIGVGVGPVGVYVGAGPDYAPYSDYAYAYGGPRYRYGASHDIYGGPPSDLFNFQGPNRGAQERAH